MLGGDELRMSADREAAGQCKRGDSDCSLNHDGSPCASRCGLAGNWIAVRKGGLPELVLDLVDASLCTGLVLLAARGAGDANGADRFFTDHNRQRAARGRDIGEEELSGHGILADILGK